MTTDETRRFKAILATIPSYIDLRETESGQLVPLHTMEAIHGYLKEGIPLGGFLQSVFRNDLMESFSRADDMNRYALYDICKFIYNEVPSAARNYKGWLMLHQHLREGKTDEPDLLDE